MTERLWSADFTRAAMQAYIAPTLPFDKARVTIIPFTTPFKRWQADQRSLARTIIRGCIGAALVFSTGCKAADPPALRLVAEEYEVRPNESVLASASRVADKIERTFAVELGASEPIAFQRDQIGVQGNRLLVAAVTPIRGIFAIIPLNLIANGSGTVPVCYFGLVWPKPNAERSSAGLLWATRQWPDDKCRSFKRDDSSWELLSAGVQRQVAVRRGRAAIVSLADSAEPNFPQDLRAAMQTALRRGERLDRVAPLPSMLDMRAYGWTSNGRTLLAIPAKYYSDVCVVEASPWTDVVKKGSLVAMELERICQPLFDEIEEARSERVRKLIKQQPIQNAPAR